MIPRLTRLFPLWALLFSVLAYVRPGLFVDAKDAIVPLLGAVMFGMGMTLTPANFTAVLARPRTVGIGILLQYTVMPLAAWSIGYAMGLEPSLLAGLVLVGTCPGGTASNVICYLARGDVALSITLTTVSTLMAVVLTPALAWLYLGHTVAVPVLPMLFSVVKVILLPVGAGVLLNHVARERLSRLRAVFPLLSVVAIVVIIAIIVALNRGNLATVGAAAGIAVMLHNLTGLAAGYGIARGLGLDERIARTLAIEVGMQNSGLAVALALKYFGPAAALPGALFSVWHNLSGSLLAAVWSRRPAPAQQAPR